MLTVKNKRLILDVTTTRELSEFEMLQAVAFYYYLDPERAKLVFAAVEKCGGAIHCPFPGDCKSFPCATLSCNANVCNNGFAYRM